ncbi:MAG: HK97 gp10 family phage protein [Actinobacteria bacterium]|nr:HK97 gp10 family phage protein [Actinomycetota bacterium]
MIQGRVSRVALADLDAALEEILVAVDADLSGIADYVEAEAKTTAQFVDKTGNLRKTIKKRKSKFPEGGYIVVATAPHAHLVEFGHAMWVKGVYVKDHVKPRKFLRIAKEKGWREAIRRFRGKDAK